MANFTEATAKIDRWREFAIEIPDLGWDAVGGLDAVKSALQEAIAWPLAEPTLLKHLGLPAPRGILLYGPPGNGKTLLVNALAGQSGLNLITVESGRWRAKSAGEARQAMREVFARAREAAPCIAFLDEVDALAPGQDDIRPPPTAAALRQLLIELDDIAAPGNTWVIAATNRPEALNEALLRPGRFDYRLEVPKPDRAARAAILAVHLRGRPLAQGLAIERLAERTEGLSAAQLRLVCDRATATALRRMFPAGGRTERDVSELKIRPEDFGEALVEKH